MLELRHWIWLAVGIRLLSATTHSAWQHPDEWFQTAELGHFLQYGLLSATREVGLHLRNLSWPMLLRAPLALAEAVAPGQAGSRVLFIQALAGMLDLLMVWGWWQLSRRLAFPPSKAAALRALGMALLVLPWFTAIESVRPSQEHLSAIALWTCLGLIASGRYRRAGLACVAIGAFRYPSGLLSAGILAAVSWDAWRSRSRRELGRFALGLASGFVLFGLADWAHYGRPWESLWMYLQYNVFTGQGARAFGAQSAFEYLRYLSSHWGGPLLPLGIALAPLAALGTWRGLRAGTPWAWALACYVAGHLLIAHKEPRFVAPVEALLLWAAYSEAVTRLRSGIPGWTRALKYAAALLLLANGALLLKAIWGETWVANGTYFEMPSHLRAAPGACAVISVRKPISTLLPGWRRASVPEPAFGFFPSERRAPSFAQARERPLIWIERSPECRREQPVLVHVHRPDPRWESEARCELQPSGVLRLAPRSRWDELLRRGWVAGSWYRCPSSVLAEFRKTSTRKVLARSLGRLEPLPRWGASGEELVAAGLKASPESAFDGTLGEW